MLEYRSHQAQISPHFLYNTLDAIIWAAANEIILGYGNGRFGHPEQDRALSIREGAILQSFPPNYRFVPVDSYPVTRDIGIHIGNAVPVELGRAIGLSIMNHLQEVNNG
jgi:site-specific DNA-cytosine methylase